MPSIRLDTIMKPLFCSLARAAALVLVAGFACPSQAQVQYSWSNLAGQAGGAGSADGAGSSARFSFPTGVVADGDGNIYVADGDNSALRKVTSSGVVTIFAGMAGFPGSADGSGSGARFFGPRGLSRDASGNIYVADTANHTIRKVTPAGVVTTLAGLAGSAGSADGAGSAARFSSPRGIAADAGGNVWVADSDNALIRLVTPAGVVTTIAGLAGTPGTADGTGAAARFRDPRGAVVEAGGSILVADYGNHSIRRVSPGGVVTTFAGLSGTFGSTDGTGTAARFSRPVSVAMDGAGNAYVADNVNATVRRISPAAVVTTIAGLAGSRGSADGTGSAARFSDIRGIGTDQNGISFVADGGNNNLRRVTPAGVVTTLAGLVGSPGSADGTGAAARFFNPQGIAVDGAGNYFLADYRNATIRRVTPAGVVSTFAGQPGVFSVSDGTLGTATFSSPKSLAFDPSGNLFVAEDAGSVIRKITPSGQVITFAGSGFQGSNDGTGTAASFSYPTGIVADASGNLFVSDQLNSTIRKITPAGAVTTVAGMVGVTGSADGAGAAARFNLPAGLAIDGGGNVYVADYGNSTIRRMTPAGAVTTVAGLAGSVGAADGVGAAARLRFAQGVVSDASGNLWVADTINDTIRFISASGEVSTIGGVPLQSSGVDGPGAAARFGRPVGIALAPGGAVVVADADNNRLVVGIPFSATSLSGFAAWQTAYFNAADRSDPTVSGPLADLEGDGFGNLLEYAFALDPRVSDSGAAAPRAGAAGGFVTLSFRRVPTRVDLNYVVEASGDLAGGSWVEIARSAAGGPTAATPGQSPSSINETAANGIVYVTVGDVVPAGPGSPRRFIRLRVERP